MKMQDKQFTVKYNVRSLVHGVSIPFFMQETLHTKNQPLTEYGNRNIIK